MEGEVLCASSFSCTVSVLLEKKNIKFILSISSMELGECNEGIPGSGFHRKRGPCVKAPIESLEEAKEQYKFLVVGKFIDSKEFEVDEIQSWVDSWGNKGEDSS